MLAGHLYVHDIMHRWGNGATVAQVIKASVPLKAVPVIVHVWMITASAEQVVPVKVVTATSVWTGGLTLSQRGLKVGG